MTIDQLRMVVGFCVIASQLLCLSLIATIDALTFSERLELAALVGPIFAFFATVILRGAFAGMFDKWDPSPVHPTVAIAATAFALIFLITSPGAILLYAVGSIGTVSDLKLSLGIIELCMGAYTGFFLDTLLGRARDVVVSTPSTPPSEAIDKSED